MFDKMRLFEVLLSPVNTEKATAAKEGNKIVLNVAPWANKPQIAAAVKVMFGVDVLDVNTLVCRGKIKRVGKHFGKQSNFKKAFLTLKNGSDVDLFGFIGQEVSNKAK